MGTQMTEAEETDDVWGPLVQKWTRIADSLAPYYLSVSKEQNESIRRLIRPSHAGGKHTRIIKDKPIPMGVLVPVQGIDPTVVKNFVHAVDKRFDDRVSEDDVKEINYKAQLGVPEMLVRDMFDEILAYRPKVFRAIREVTWDECFLAMSVRKQWVEGILLEVETSSENWSLLHSWAQMAEFAKNMCLNWGQFLPSMEGLRPGVKRINRFFQKLVFACDEDKIPWSEPLIQQFLRPVEQRKADPQARRFLRVVATGLRRVWSYPHRPYRRDWLRILRAAEKFPIVKPFKHGGEAQPEKAKPRNSATWTAKYTGLPQHMIGMQMRPIVSQVRIGGQGPNGRSLRPTDQYPCNTSTWQVVNLEQAAEEVWERPGAREEGLVNELIEGGDSALVMAAKQGNKEVVDYLQDSSGAGDGDAKRSDQLQCTFEAQRLFKGIQQKISRASEERRFIMNSMRKSSSMPVLASTCPLVTRAVFSNSCSDGVDYPSNSTNCHWNGAHLDHTKLVGVHENPKISTMSPRTRQTLWNTNFHPPDLQAKKTEAVDGRQHILGKWSEYEPYRPRELVDGRSGKFGRKLFTPQVSSMPVMNPHNVRELDTKPEEVFWRGQEQLRNRMERTLPKGQKQHFMQHRPISEAPHKSQEIAVHPISQRLTEYGAALTGGPGQTTSSQGIKAHRRLHDTIFGGKQDSMLGWGQTRCTHYENDYKTFSRPLGSTDFDRQVPVGPDDGLRTAPLTAKRVH